MRLVSAPKSTPIGRPAPPTFSSRRLAQRAAILPTCARSRRSPQPRTSAPIDSHHIGLDDIETALAVDYVNQPAIVDRHVVGRHALMARRRVRLVIACFARREWIRNI